MLQEPMTATLGRSAVGRAVLLRTDRCRNTTRPGLCPPGRAVPRQCLTGTEPPAWRRSPPGSAQRSGGSPRPSFTRAWPDGCGPSPSHPRYWRDGLPDLDSDASRWHPDRSTPHELWLPAPSPPTLDPEEGPARANSWQRSCTVTWCRCTRPQDCGPISPPAPRGNAASALVGTLRVLHDWCHRTGHPEAAERAVALTHDPARRPVPCATPGTRIPPSLNSHDAAAACITAFQAEGSAETAC